MGHTIPSGLKNSVLTAKESALACRKNLRLIVGFACLFLWTWLILQDSAFYALYQQRWSSRVIHPWSVATITFAGVFVLIGLISRFLDMRFRNRRALLVFFTLSAAGLACNFSLLYSVLPAHQAMGLVLVGGCIVGLATPFFYLEFVRCLLKLSLAQIIAIVSTATILASLIYFAAINLPWNTIVGLPLVLLTGIVFALWPAKHQNVELSVKAATAPRAHLYIPWKLNATALIQGLTFGAGRMFLASSEAGWLSLPNNALYLVGYALAAVLLIGFSLFLKQRFDTLIYKIGFPLLALGTLLLMAPVTASAGCFISALGYRIVDLLIWSLVPYLAITKKVPLGWLVGWSTACLYVGVMAGYFFVDLVLILADNSLALLPMPLIAFIAMLSALILTSSSNDAKAWGSLRPATQTLLQPYFDEAVNALILEKQLTQRQAQVFTLLCQGKNRKEIAAELVLSQETVKVHMRNVYQAFSVHSQQELKAVLEAEELRLSH